MRWVYVAYGAAWSIHIIYFISLTVRYRHVRRDIADLERQ
jgi:hypothetical protein